MQDSGWTVALDLPDGSTQRFLAVAAPVECDGCYELLAAVRGRAVDQPRHGVFARWVVHDAAHAAGFEESRRELFTLRHEYIESFVIDLLLRSREADRHEYVVVGLYTDEAGPKLAREHPAIVEWASQHPPSLFTAEDITGMRFGSVAEWRHP